VEVGVVEPVTGEELSLAADWLVLSVGVEPEGAGLAERLGLAVDEDGFVEAEHAKMKPLDVRRGEVGKAAAGGVYVAGLAHSPRFVEEAVAQGQGAAMRAAAYLTREREGERATSVWVNERLCSFCGLCVAACPYEARVMNYETRVADVDYALCEGCGVCAMVCPNKATLQKTFEHKQVMAVIDAAL
jgi:heterodisulfide reductase subunit A